MRCNGIIPGATRKIHSKLRKACVIVLMVVLHQSRAPFPLLRISHTVRGPPLQTAHCTPNWCTHNPQLEQTRTRWCYIQPCTLQPCVITSDTSLDELLRAKFKKNLKGLFPCVNTPQSRISGPCKALNLGLHPSRRLKQPGNTRMSFTEHTSLYFFVSVVFLRDLQPKQVWHAGICNNPLSPNSPSHSKE